MFRLINIIALLVFTLSCTNETIYSGKLLNQENLQDLNFKNKDNLINNFGLPSYNDEILNKNGRLILKTDDDNLFNFSIDEIKSSKFILNDYTKDLHSSSKFDLYKSVKTKYEKKFLLQGKKIKLLECLK